MQGQSDYHLSAMNQPTVDGTSSFHEQEDEDDEEIDDEFRRAQEMALAVAALGGGGSTYSYQTAMDIRMAVADVMSGIGDDDGRPNNTYTNNANKNAQYQQQQQQQDEDIMQLKRQLYAASRENHVQQARNEKLRRKIRLQERQQQQQQQTKKQERSKQQIQQQQQSDNFVLYLLASVWKDTVGPYVNPYLGPYLEFFNNKSLSGQNLFIVLLSMNGCILYLTTRPQSTLMSFWNAIFVLNMSVYICVTTTTTETVHKELDDDENKRFIPRQDSSGTISSDTEEEDDDDPNKQKQQEELLLATAAAAVSKRPVSTIRLEWLDGIIFDENSILELEQLQPESTLAERRRFLKARKFCVKAASAQLGTYLQWRQDNRLDEFFPSTFLTTDTDDWISAARGALEIHNTTGGHVTVKSLPRLVSIFEGGDNSNDNIVVCKNGARVVHVLPCQLDSLLAQPSTYALAVAMYLDRKLNRNYTEKVTVVIDIRHGTGWKNPSSVAIVPFIKLVVGLLNTYFPERLSRCILFPLPRTATMLFNTAKTYLDPDTAAKIQVCSGGGSVKAVVPEKVFDFLSKKAVESMEKRRKSFFVIS